MDMVLHMELDDRIREIISLQPNISHAVAEQHPYVLFLMLVCIPHGCRLSLFTANVYPLGNTRSVTRTAYVYIQYMLLKRNDNLFLFILQAICTPDCNKLSTVWQAGSLQGDLPQSWHRHEFLIWTVWLTISLMCVANRFASDHASLATHCHASQNMHSHADYDAS